MMGLGMSSTIERPMESWIRQGHHVLHGRGQATYDRGAMLSTYCYKDMDYKGRPT